MIPSSNLTQSTIDKLAGIEKFTDTDRFVNKIVRIIDQLTDSGWYPVVADGLRTPSQQAQKVREGYSQTLNSKHLLGQAVDIVDKRWYWHGPAAALDFKFWTDLGKCANLQGLQWGGDWPKFKDMAHVETKD